MIIPALLGLGALIGPVQPINAELAVEVAYPADENAIEALQQLCGNLFSALLVYLRLSNQLASLFKKCFAAREIEASLFSIKNARFLRRMPSCQI